jgi:beta-lactam-binding protein with PASTA domain
VSTVSSDPVVGRRLDARYLVEEPLAQGGMATVYRGVDTRLSRPVAIKVMNPAFSLDPGFVARFTREAQATAGLNDPHVVSVYDQGDDDGVVYLVMEYVSGSTLRDLLNDRGPLTPDQALDVFEPMLQGLSAAHRAGLVHRDIKPENVLIRDDGMVKVSDFGLARAVSAAEASAATQGLFMGTVAYVAPEQVERQVSDPRSDVYSAGIVLFEMLVGHPPFTGESAWNVASQHVQGQVPLPSAERPGLPEGLDALVSRSTRRDPDSRPDDAGVLLSQARAVRQSLHHPTPGGLQVSEDLNQTVVVATAAMAAGAAARHDTSVVPLAGPADQTAPPKDPGSSPLRRRRWRGPVALLIVIAAAVAVGAGAGWWGSGRFTPVPGVVGQTSKQAEATLAVAGLEVAYADPQYSEIVPEGQVMSSKPPPGGRVERGGTVTLVLSLGPQRFDVPKLQNLTVAQARSRLADQSLALGSVSKAFSDTVAQGRVISSQPKAGTSVRKDTAVSLVVSKGLPPVTVPSLVNRSYDDAKRLLEGVGLTIAQSGERYSESVAEGSVISQNPGADASVDQGGTVNVVVSKGPPLVTVPDVVDDPVDVAIAKLKEAGLKYKIYEPFGISPLNRVASQSPKGGTQAPKGSVVQLGII